MARKRTVVVDRTFVKKCPYCKQQYPFARRSCSCGHKFTAKATPKARRKERQDNNEIGNRLRRAVRTKRSRPDFFNPSENHSVRRRNVESDARKKRRGRPRGAISKPKPDAEKAKEKEVQKPVEEDVYSNVPPGRAAIHSLILGEINRKMAIQNFKPA